MCGRKYLFGSREVFYHEDYDYENTESVEYNTL